MNNADSVTPFLNKLGDPAKLATAQREIAKALRGGLQQRQEQQVDIHGSRLQPRDTSGWPRNDYQRERQHMPLFPFLTRDAYLHDEFAPDRVRVGFEGMAAVMAGRNNAGLDAPRREIVGFSDADLKAVRDILDRHIQQ